MDVEQFIDLVRERPCLYDYKDAFHKNKKEKEKKWKEIAAAMEITSELAKCKWKNLKENYSKHLKGTTATSGHYLKYLHWTWAPNMEFMKKYMNFTSASKNNRDIRGDDEIECVDSTPSSLRSDGISEDISLDNKTGSQTHVSRQCELTPRIILPCMENQEDDDYDATDLIFLGYAKAIKEFSIRKQAEIKLRIAKIITEEEVANYEENSAYPDSPFYSHTPSPQNDPLSSKHILTHEIRIKSEEG